MELIVDLHIHSHYSRATSPDSNLEGLYRWGKIKGINIIGAGDFTHPMWFAELKEKLTPAEPGLFRLREDISSEIDKTLPASVRNNLIRFILTVEISTIYSKTGKVRKLHNLVIAPSFETAATINSQLERIGNLKADGRPILGMDSKRLLQITLDTDKRAMFIPAHIWTPWFAMFGSKSGFNSITEAFEELAPEVRAIETGLSSDPFMNWRLDELQNIAIISNSDAHSPQKLGREATIIHLHDDVGAGSSGPNVGITVMKAERTSPLRNLSYDFIINAIRTNDERLIGTIEFFPQEGKYHFDGHRACNVKFTPIETKAHKGICPVCKNPLTIGVDYRVGEIANHPDGYKPEHHKVVEYIIPLTEILAEMHGVKSPSKKVWADFDRMIAAIGNEFDILRKIPVSEISKLGFPELAKIIDRMRHGDVFIDPGYDGVYGVIKVFNNKIDRTQQLSSQMSLL